MTSNGGPGERGRFGAVSVVASTTLGAALVHVVLVSLLPAIVCLEHLPEDPPPPGWYVGFGAAVAIVPLAVAGWFGREKPTRRRFTLGAVALAALVTFGWLAVAAAGIPVSRSCT